jgi:hypothetical protein
MMMMMMMMIFAHHLSPLPNALVVSAQRRRRKSSTHTRKGRTHRRFLAFLLRKRFLSTEKKRKERERERERDACAVCPTFEFVVYLRILAEMNWPKIDIFLFKI